MGKGVSLPKISAPKITVGDPTKLVTNAVQGAANAYTTTTGTVIGAAGTVANQGLNAVGSVLQNPAAAPVLGAAGTAFGIPPGLTAGLVGQAGNYSDRKADFAPMPQTQNFSPPANNSMLFIMLGGFAALLILIFALKRK